MILEPEQKAGSLALLGRLLTRMRSHATLVAAILVCLILHQGAEIALPWLIGQAVDGMIAGNAIFWLVGLIAGAGVIRAASRFGQGIGQTWLAQHVVTDLRLEYHERVLGLAPDDLSRWRKGELIARGTRDVEKMRTFFGDIIFQAIELTILIVGALTVLALTAWPLALMAGGMALLTGIAMALCAPGLRRRVRSCDDSYDEVASAIQETVAGARVVRAFRREDAQNKAFDGRVSTFLDKCFEAFDYFAVTLPIANMTFGLAVPAGLLIGGWLVMERGLGIGEVTMALLYLRTIHMRLRVVSRVVMVGQTAAASAERTHEVLDRASRIGTPTTPLLLPETGGRLELDDVWVHREGREILRGLTLTAEPGETLAIVGPTGGGKSTLIELLGRLSDPTRGELRLDGISMPRLDPKTLRKEVGVVFQETFLFSATVADAIAFGRPDATSDEIEQAASIAQADRFIAELPDGMQTIIGERGVTLSGGQKQRLAIARAVCSRPRLLVLDDATASVDSRTEQALQSGLEDAASMTLVWVAQRLSTIRHADRIAVLDQGAITEQGTHDELVATGGWYADTYAMQTQAGMALTHD